ncbi:MAG: VWA domain-containing protein [Deltaproteobacteria bacterium]|nr:VWA domain-containing protein [Deltaproteobacteria bacterium]
MVAGGSISAVLSGPAAGGGGLGSGGIGLTSSIGDQRFHRHDRGGRAPGGPGAAALDDFDTEEYAKIDENPFKNAADNPLSTFSIDVDTASYSNVRRFLRDGALPPADAVRLEELVNYFTYEYPDPRGETPFSVTTELATCPWAPKHHLLMVGLQGRRMDTASMPRNNLVFLMDVSGSMNSPDKLPLLKAAFRLLVDSLRPEDRVAIVVYAGAAGVVLPSTPGSEKPRILEAIDRLSAGGSTAGGAGIQLAYQIAKEHLLDGGNNRVILATDGDFNVGTSSTGALTRLIEEKRKDGIFLTVLGFGRHNTKDSRMEALADKGNGNYAYIDSVAEARKVLVTQLGGTLLTIAKDVKIQVEFNPAKVAEYRLIGYENRLLAREDFTNDAKDAGELGAGHTVTALYEIVPLSAVEGASAPTAAPAEPMKYSESMVRDSAKASPELCTVNLRWKKPDGDTSTLETFPVLDRVRAIAESSGDLRWAASVALFGMALRGSELAAGAGLPLAAELARGAVGWDPGGYRTEFMELLKIAQELSRSR